MTPPPPVEPTHVRFPPRWRNTLVPLSTTSAGACGTALYSACNPAPVIAQQLLWLVARVGGGRALPGPRVAWRPPLDEAVFTELVREWTVLLGRPLEGIAVHERLQKERPAITLLLCAGPRTALVRVRRDAVAMEKSQRLSAIAQTFPLDGLRVPRILGSGVAQGWHWNMAEAMSRRPHLPVLHLPPGLTRAVSGLVAAASPRPEGIPAHWGPMHGDLTPWNLRLVGRVRWLIDWEDYGWGPQHADELYFRAVVHAIGRASSRPVLRPGEEEAAQYWLDVIADRPIAASEQRLKDRLTLALGGRL